MSINFNCDVSKLKKYSESVGLINHIFINIFRHDSPEYINKDVENQTLKNWKESENYKKDLELLKKNPEVLLRFFVTTLNLEYNKENLPKILEWANEIKTFLDENFNAVHVELHLNESKPHIHAIILNMDQKREKIGNYNIRNENIKLSGKYFINDNGEIINLTPNKIKNYRKADPDFFKKYKMQDHGKDTLTRIWKEGEAINRKFCEKYNLKFEQEPTTEYGKRRKIKETQLKSLSIEEFRQVSKEIDQGKFTFERKLKDLETKNIFLEKENETKNKKIDELNLELKNKDKQINNYIDKDEEIKQLKKENDNLNKTMKKEYENINNFEKFLEKNYRVVGETFYEKVESLGARNKIYQEQIKNLKNEINYLRNNQKKNEKER